MLQKVRSPWLEHDLATQRARPSPQFDDGLRALVNHVYLGVRLLRSGRLAASIAAPKSLGGGFPLAPSHNLGLPIDAAAVIPQSVQYLRYNEYLEIRGQFERWLRDNPRLSHPPPLLLSDPTPVGQVTMRVPIVACIYMYIRVPSMDTYVNGTKSLVRCTIALGTPYCLLSSLHELHHPVHPTLFDLRTCHLQMFPQLSQVIAE